MRHVTVTKAIVLIFVNDKPIIGKDVYYYPFYTVYYQESFHLSTESRYSAKDNNRISAPNKVI